MKKIVCVFPVTFDILDPKDYVIIEKDNQRISDKYVDLWGDKINKYGKGKALKRGDVVISKFYDINFGVKNLDISVYFKKPKYYDIYRNSDELTPELKQVIKSKNSILDFNYIKIRIVELFSKDIKIK